MATVFVRAYLKTYTNNIWTTLIQAPAGKTLVIRHYMFMATSGTASVSMRIVSSTTVEKAVQVNAYALATDKPLNCTSAFIVLQEEEKIEVKASVADVHFSCWGGYE